ncbi:hypothetical protein HPB51_019060 [Rhipicephalus microplus]|uniref:Uncharacterized protein n=1 Tax=Rhipicephalus microplus TaxID=6941 RepID=A0A9J6E3Z0_RHIMP|nr:hypothetical protein HPB51_019060 [Rhipicephalus microplus]
MNCQPEIFCVNISLASKMTPQSSHLWCPPAHPAETATDPAQAVEQQREHDDALGSGDHPVPVSSGGPAQGHTAARACTGAAACDHGAARSRDGAQHGESAAHREPRGSAAGHVSGWTCARHFPAELVHSGPGPQPDSDTRHTGADPELSGTDTGGPAGPAATPCHGPDPGTSDGAQAPWGTSRTAWHPNACHSTEPGAKAQHLSGTATHDVAPLICHSPGTATDAATAAGHAAHADHAGPAHTGCVPDRPSPIPGADTDVHPAADTGACPPSPPPPPSSWGPVGTSNLDRRQYSVLCTQRQHCHPPSCQDLATHGPLSACPTRSP